MLQGSPFPREFSTIPGKDDKPYLVLDMEGLNVDVSPIVELEKEDDEGDLMGERVGKHEHDYEQEREEIATTVASFAKESAMDEALEGQWKDASRLRSIPLYAGKDVGLSAVERSLHAARRKHDPSNEFRQPLSCREEVSRLKVMFYWFRCAFSIATILAPHKLTYDDYDRLLSLQPVPMNSKTSRKIATSWTS